MAANTRYLLVGAGRSGSSLLAAIMADNGADFHMPRVDDWNAGSGAYEHAEIATALKWYARIKHIEASLIPNTVLVPFFGGG